MDAKPEKCEEMKHTILDAVENASRLMSQVHEKSTPERLDLEEVDIANLIDIIVSTILIPSDIDVHLALEKQILRIDRGKMGHALINILSNAVEMLPSKGLLKISTKTEGDNFVIEIKNSGLGIPQSSKTAQTSSDHPELASSRKIIKAHGGNLEILSELGIGTTVQIILPLQAYPQIPQKPKTRDGVENSNQK
jgi:signal transduction histidine kinase